MGCHWSHRAKVQSPCLTKIPSSRGWKIKDFKVRHQHAKRYSTKLQQDVATSPLPSWGLQHVSEKCGPFNLNGTRRLNEGTKVATYHLFLRVSKAERNQSGYITLTSSVSPTQGCPWGKRKSLRNANGNKRSWGHSLLHGHRTSPLYLYHCLQLWILDFLCTILRVIRFFLHFMILLLPFLFLNNPLDYSISLPHCMNTFHNAYAKMFASS